MIERGTDSGIFYSMSEDAVTESTSEPARDSWNDEVPSTPEAPQRPDRTWLVVSLAFVVFWVGYLTFFGPRNRRPLENSGIDLPAVYDWSLEDLNEKPVSFAQFKGKTLFLNIWATWCGPCVGEMPSIARLADNPRLKGKNIEFVCVSVDDSAATVRRFLRDKNWSMTILRAQALPEVFQTDGIPATFVIAPNGRIVAAEVGSSEWDDPHVVEILEKLASSAKG
jgi:thiol-disulfide isomerase/thioredoxin